MDVQKDGIIPGTVSRVSAKFCRPSAKASTPINHRQNPTFRLTRRARDSPFLADPDPCGRHEPPVRDRSEFCTFVGTDCEPFHFLRHATVPVPTKQSIVPDKQAGKMAAPDTHRHGSKPDAPLKTALRPRRRPLLLKPAAAIPPGDAS